MNLKHYKQLDGIRATAALMVIFYHFATQIPAGSDLNDFLKKISPFGQTGVTLFFVLSGFLITRILLVTKVDNRYFTNFYLRRALRIFPLYYLYLLIELVVIPMLSGNHVPLENSWHFWVYLQNFAFTFGWPANGPNHYWSLAVEEHFYLFWPLFVYFSTKASLKKISIAFIVLSLLCRVLLLFNGLGSGVYFTFTNIDALAIGALAALMETESGFRRSATTYLLGFVSLFIPLAIINWFVSGKSFDVIQAVKVPIIAFAYFFLIIYVMTVKQRSVVTGFLTSKPMTYLGKISYGLYVFHPLCFSYGSKIIYFNGWVLNMVFQLALSIALATLSFYCFESPFLKMKKYFDYNEKRSGARRLAKTKLIKDSKEQLRRY